MPVMLIEHTPDGIVTEEYPTYREMREALKEKAKLYPAALLHKAKNDRLILFEGKRRAAEIIVHQILDEFADAKKEVKKDGSSE